MTFETKYGIGDRVWCLPAHDTPMQGTVSQVTYDGSRAIYRVQGELFIEDCGEDNVFATEDEARAAFLAVRLKRAKARLDELVRQRLQLKHDIDMQYMLIRRLENGDD